MGLIRHKTFNDPGTHLLQVRSNDVNRLSMHNNSSRSGSFVLGFGHIADVQLGFADGIGLRFYEPAAVPPTRETAGYEPIDQTGNDPFNGVGLAGIRVYDGANGAFTDELDVETGTGDHGTDQRVGKPASDPVDFCEDQGNQRERNNEEGLMRRGQGHEFAQALQARYKRGT